MAPALIVQGGLNPLAVHLFIIYYSSIHIITPPVATDSFMAAGMAGASPLKTARVSMRLGVVLMFIPFFFVLHPALVLEGPILQSLYLFVQSLVGIFFIAGGLEGYLLKVGKIGWWSRPALIIAGILIAYPGLTSTAYGVGLVALVVVILLAIKRVAPGKVQLAGPE